MRYSFKKKRSLSEEEKARVMVNYVLHERFNLGTIEHLNFEPEAMRSLLELNSVKKLISDLEDFIVNPSQQFSFRLFSWLLSNGTPALITFFQRYIPEQLSLDWRSSLFLNLTKKLNPQQLIPLDFIIPDIQIIERGLKRNCLICFSGIGHRMMMPNQLFNAFALSCFDSVIYLHDVKKVRFVEGVEGVAEQPETLIPALRELTKEYQSTSVLGVSSGGIVALQAAHGIQADKTLLFSPAFEYNDQQAIAKEHNFNASNLKIFFNQFNDLDADLLEQWNDSSVNSCIELMPSERHNSALSLLEQGRYDSTMQWLSEASHV